MFNVLFLSLLVFSWANGENIQNMSFKRKNLNFSSNENKCNYTINGLGYNNDSKASRLDINNSKRRKNSFIVNEKFYWDVNRMESNAPILDRIGNIFAEIVRLIGRWIMNVVDLYAIFAGID